MARRYPRGRIKTMAVHQDLTKQMNHANTVALLAEIAQLKAENEALAKAQARGRTISFKVTVAKPKEDGTMSKGGAISAYGMGKFPVTLYRGQWERLIEAMPELTAFIQANAARLSVKE